LLVSTRLTDSSATVPLVKLMPPAASVAQSTNHYILAVDDMPDNLLLLKMMLESAGYRIELAESGDAALAQIQQALPDLIILDVMMPGISGYEVTQKIRSDPRLPYIPILLISAHEQSSVVKGLDAGADDFIRKPVELDELQARVRSLLRLKQSIDQRENFISCLTHDLRTPLIACDRMLDLLRQGAFGEVVPPVKEALAGISSSNQNLLQMLNNLLEVYCYELGEKKLSFISVDLHELISEVVTELKPLALDKNLELTFDWQTDVREMRCDRMELRRMFTNLIGNAIKFTDTGTVKVSGDDDDGVVVINIQDTGVGIAEADQAQIFERFRRAKHNRSGNGLGLHLCQQVIQAHQGELTVQSQPNQGSTFILRLPLSS